MQSQLIFCAKWQGWNENWHVSVFPVQLLQIFSGNKCHIKELSVSDSLMNLHFLLLTGQTSILTATWIHFLLVTHFLAAEGKSPFGATWAAWSSSCVLVKQDTWHSSQYLKSSAQQQCLIGRQKEGWRVEKKEKRPLPHSWVFTTTILLNQSEWVMGFCSMALQMQMWLTCCLPYLLASMLRVQDFRTLTRIDVGTYLAFIQSSL